LNTIDLILIAFSITSSAFSLAIVSNVQKCLSVFEKIRLIALFTFIPLSMLWLGYWLGVMIRTLLNWNNEWILVVLLMIVGIRMMKRSYQLLPENRSYHYGKFKVIFVLSIALGLQASIIGIGFAFSVVALNLFMGLMMAFGILMNLFGIVIGKRSGNFQWGNKIHFLGGVLLTGLALKQMIYLLGIL